MHAGDDEVGALADRSAAGQEVQVSAPGLVDHQWLAAFAGRRRQRCNIRQRPDIGGRGYEKPVDRLSERIQGGGIHADRQVKLRVQSWIYPDRPGADQHQTRLRAAM